MVNYETNMMNIIKHIDIGLPHKEQLELALELSFFDVNNSPMYRYSMTNPFVNHVDTKRYVYIYVCVCVYICVCAYM